MPGPNLSPQEIAQLQKDAAKATSAAATFTAQIAALQQQAAQLAVSDGAFKKFFDYYNDDIIGKYDAERRLINGQYIASPIVEADIVSCASLAGGRIQPGLPATDVTRIQEFDGGPLVVDPVNEIQTLNDQETLQKNLVQGFTPGVLPGPTPAATVLTDTTITAASTTMKLKDLTTTFTLGVNQVFVIIDGSDLAVVKITSFVMQTTPTPPPYIADVGIQMIIPPTGTITTGKQLKEFTGFTNAERTNKTATVVPAYQKIMDYLVTQLNSKLNARITSYNSQLAVIAANQDPQPGTELTTATSNVNASKTFVLNYITNGADISDTGLTGLETERAARKTQATARVAQIVNAYTGRSQNYFNERYNVANNRANTARGTLRVQKAAEQSAGTSQGFADTLTAQANAINSILP